MNGIKAEQTICTKCGVALGDDASEGLCPGCLFQIVLTPELDETEALSAGDSAPGKIRYFGDYEIGSEIAHGGMGVVYRARQVSLKRDVALKMILAGLFASRNLVQRFCTEAEAAAQLDHPNIVPIYEIGQHEGQHYFSMKLIDGFSLARELQGKPWTMKHAAEFMVKVARAVHYAHQRGILHRDIHPSNILLDSKGEPHVTDFGLAKITESDRNVTRTNAIMGSPAYMSPEQAAGQTKNLTTASDVYSLGAVFYELLTGRPPFQGESVMEIMQQVAALEPIRPRMIQAHIDRDLETICLKCLEKDAPRRYGSAEVLADDLGRWLRGEPILGRPSSAWDRTRKWVRRNPALASLGASLVLVFTLGFTGTLWQWRQAVHHAQAEAKQRRLADENRQLAEENRERASQNLYDSDMSLAQHAWDDGDLGYTLSRLEAHLPRAGETDRRGFEWFYFWNLCQGDQRMTLTNHTQPVNCVAFSPDGKRLATGSVGNPVQIWDTVTGKIVKTLPEQNVVSLAFAPDGQMLGVGGRDKVVVWNLESEHVVFKREKAWTRFRIAFARENLLVIGKNGGGNGSDGGSAELWDYVTGECTHTFPESGGHVALSPGTGQLATGNWNGTIKIWDLASEQLVKTLQTEGALAMAFSPDGLTLATSYWGHDVKLWDVIIGQETASLSNQQHRVWSLAFSPDSRFLATGGAAQTINLWEVATRRRTEQLKGHGNEILSVAFSADGQALASGSKDQTAMLWSLKPDRAVTTVSNVDSRPIFSADNQTVAAGIGQNRVAAWDVATLQLKATFPGAESAVAFSPDGSALLTRGSNFFLKTFDIATQTVRKTLLRGPGVEIQKDAVSPDGQVLVAFLTNGTLAFSNVGTGVVMASIPNTNAIFDLAFSPNGKLLAAACGQYNAQWGGPAAVIWDVLTHQRVAELAGHTDIGLSVAFSPDGNTLATSSADNSIRFWSTATWKELPPALRQKSYVTSLAFSPNGRTFVSACADGTIKMWNPVSRRELASIKFEPDGRNFAFAPDGQTLAIRTSNDLLYLWRAPVLENQPSHQQGN